MQTDGTQGFGRFGWASRIATRLMTEAGRVGAQPTESGDATLQRRLLVIMSVGTMPLTALWSTIYFAAGAPFAAVAPAVYSLVTPLNTVLLYRTRNFGVYRLVQLLMTLVLPWMVTISLGGFKSSSAVIIWAALCPLVSLLVEDLHRTVLWIVGFVLLVIISAFLQPHLTPAELPEALVTWYFVLNLGAVIAIAFALLYYFVGQRNFFQQRSEALLLNILPKEISDALKTDRSAIAAHYDSASVLFADIVEFTPMAAAMPPLDLVNLLNEVFQCFDDLVEKHGLEKIKTIGDCYMVAAGVPRERSDHAIAIVQFALDVRDVAASRTFGDRKLGFRIGVNTGPVVAGVIGRKKFIYDLWGEAVNIASRMESHGESGAVQITCNTYDLVKDHFECESRGTITVKGVDAIEVWRVIGRKGNPRSSPEAADVSR
jgi:adenylate cyclase